MSFQRYISDPAAVEQIGWTLVHSVWQGAVIAACMALALALLKHRSAQLRYVTACVALLLMFLAPVATFFVLSGRFDDPGILNLSAATVDAGILARSYDRLRVQLRPIFPPLIGLWAVGTGLVALRNLGAWLVLRWSLRTLCHPLRPARHGLRALVDRFGIKREVTFLETWIHCPATTGWLHPIVLLPIASLSGLTYEQLEVIVCHELAHIRRHDHLISLIQALIISLTFYHPATWWISNRIKIERENCCDDMTAAVIGNKKRYAEALFAMEMVRQHSPAFAIGANDGSLVDRVTRLINPNYADHGRNPLPVVVGLLAALLCGQLVIGSTVTPRVRTLADVRSLSGMVYDLVPLNPREDADFLAAVDRYIAPDGGTDEDVEEIVSEVLADNRPDLLAQEVLQRITPGDRDSYTKGGWTHGTTMQRDAIINLLRDRVRAEPDAPASQRYARAALLLSAQETALHGSFALEFLLREPELPVVAGLNRRDTARLRRHADDHAKLRVHLLDQTRDVDELLSTSSRERIEAELPAKLEAIADLGHLRADVRWTLAKLFARAKYVLGSEAEAVRTLREHLIGKISDPAFSRLLDVQASWAATRSSLKTWSSAQARPATAVESSAPAANAYDLQDALE